MMNILKRIFFIYMIIIGCGSNGDNSDSFGLKVTMSPRDITLDSEEGIKIIQPLSAIVIDKTNDTGVPDVEVTITSSVPPPAVIFRIGDDVSASSSLVVYTNENGVAFFMIEITINEEMEIIITATVGSSTDSSTITVEPL